MPATLSIQTASFNRNLQTMITGYLTEVTAPF